MSFIFVWIVFLILGFHFLFFFPFFNCFFLPKLQNCVVFTLFLFIYFLSSSDRFSCLSCFLCLFQEDSVSSWTQPCNHIWPQSMHAPKSTGSNVSLLCYVFKSGRCQFVWNALVVLNLFGWGSTQMLWWVSEWVKPHPASQPSKRHFKHRCSRLKTNRVPSTSSWMSSFTSGDEISSENQSAQHIIEKRAAFLPKVDVFKKFWTWWLCQHPIL